jgi:CRISPR-associated protein Cas2
MLELKAGVFVGDMSALVRDMLWQMVCQRVGEGGAILVYSTNAEQGFDWRYWGIPSRVLEDFEGLKLVRTP